MISYRTVPNFVGGEELQALHAAVRHRDRLFVETFGRRGLGPRNRVIDGGSILGKIPEFVEIGNGRIHPAVEEFAGVKLRPMDDTRRAVRIQLYERRDHDFRWHFDGNSYAALLTLTNSNRGQTHLVSPTLSRLLRLVFYPLYPFPRLFDWLPYEAFTMRAGDLLIFHGSRLLHRGVTGTEGGERLIVVYGYDEVDKKPNRIRAKIARWVNY